MVFYVIGEVLVADWELSWGYGGYCFSLILLAFNDLMVFSLGCCWFKCCTS